MYKLLIKPLLFKFDPERAHHFSSNFLKFINQIPFVSQILRKKYVVNDPRLGKEVFGIHFKNPVGLAAGFDKDAKLYRELSNFGFGFIEVGTVTPKPQAGNPKKRLFRLVEDEAIINRMGFNNGGVEKVLKRLQSNYKVLIGGNIGKNKTTANSNAADDYLICFNRLYDVVDYFVVNVSSPNTPNLRALQEKEPLKNLLHLLQEENKTKKKQKPILLKIAPDLTDEQLLDIVEIVEETNLNGIIATNTTISREGLVSEQKGEVGGLSGKPLRKRSTEIIRFLRKKLSEDKNIIGVGGIYSAEDAIEKMEAGADLVQIYSGFIYEGFSLVKKINEGILKYKEEKSKMQK